MIDIDGNTGRESISTTVTAIEVEVEDEVHDVFFFLFFLFFVVVVAVDLLRLLFLCFFGFFLFWFFILHFFLHTLVFRLYVCIVITLHFPSVEGPKPSPC